MKKTIVTLILLTGSLLVSSTVLANIDSDLRGFVQRVDQPVTSVYATKVKQDKFLLSITPPGLNSYNGGIEQQLPVITPVEEKQLIVLIDDFYSLSLDESIMQLTQENVLHLLTLQHVLSARSSCWSNQGCTTDTVDVDTAFNLVMGKSTKKMMKLFSRFANEFQNDQESNEPDQVASVDKGSEWPCQKPQHGLREAKNDKRSKKQVKKLNAITPVNFISVEQRTDMSVKSGQ